MKKLAIFALAALAFAACQREVEIPVNNTSTYKVTITAGFDEADSKTAYDEAGKFSWVEGDKVSMMVTNDETGVPDVITLTAESSGAVTTLTGDCPEGYTVADYAFYPKGTGNEYYSSDLGKVVDAENKVMNLRMWGTITPDPANPLASIPLIGKKDEKGFVQFKTATGILKITVSNIPADAYFLQLDIDDETTALNGNYSFGEDCTIYMKNIVGTPWGQKYVKFTPEADGETRDFYLPIPVGTIPAGLKVSLACTSGTLELAETKEAIEIKRNIIVRTPALAVPAEEWKSLGTGKFKDKFIWSVAGLNDYAEVEFFQSSRFPEKFRIAKPYPGENSDPYFVIDVTDPTKVKSDNYFVDVEVKTADDKPAFKPWIRNGVDYGYNYSDVLYFQENGLPGCIEIAPCYRGEEFATAGDSRYDYEIGKDHEALAIEIIFPGCVSWEAYEPEYPVGQIPLSVAMVTASDVCTHDGQQLPGLLDGNPSTIWHSNWYYAATNDPVYGIFFDITLKGKIQDFHFEFLVRAENANAAPTHIVYGVSADGVNWTKLETEDETGCVKGTTPGGTRVVLSNLSVPEPVKYIRFGITDSTNTDEGSLTGDLNFNGYKKCVNMAELELWKDEAPVVDNGSEIPDYDPIEGFEW